MGLQRSVGNRAVAALAATLEAGHSGRTAVVVQRYDTPEHVDFGAAEVTVTVAGVSMSQGEMITMGDFFVDVAQMEANPDEVRAVLRAIRSGRAGTREWQAATGGRYLELALDNESHFAPSNARLVPGGGGGRTDHFQLFANGHARALWESALGRPGPAQAHNSFACHFLTDAFAAGHTVNKADVIRRFSSRLRERGTFLDAVAARAWQDGRVQSRMSIREMTSWPNLNFDSEFMFKQFLRRVDNERPDVVANSVAKAVHDALNGLAADPTVGGLEVQNQLGRRWRLAGDETLHRSPDSLEVGRQAVAQSTANLAEVAGIGAPAMTGTYGDELLARVWAHVPYPTSEGELQVRDIVERLTDPNQTELIDTLGQLLAENIDAIIATAEEMGKIRVEPPGVLEELGREARRALDWREWARMSGVPVP
jgi:hypothetical protein